MSYDFLFLSSISSVSSSLPSILYSLPHLLLPLTPLFINCLSYLPYILHSFSLICFIIHISLSFLLRFFHFPFSLSPSTSPLVFLSYPSLLSFFPLLFKHFPYSILCDLSSAPTFSSFIPLCFSFFPFISPSIFLLCAIPSLLFSPYSPLRLSSLTFSFFTFPSPPPLSCRTFSSFFTSLLILRLPIPSCCNAVVSRSCPFQVTPKPFTVCHTLLSL